jgi:putative ABC transport system permease protein
MLIGAGCLAGLAGGAVLTKVVAGVIEAQTGLRLVLSLEAPEFIHAGLLFLVGSAITLVPALMSYRAPVLDGLRD